jgi:hypothetical protein
MLTVYCVRCGTELSEPGTTSRLYVCVNCVDALVALLISLWNKKRVYSSTNFPDAAVV